MVLKGQVFMLDLSSAFLVLLLMSFTFLAIMAMTNNRISDSYGDFMKQKKLLDASEKLLSVDLAMYSENTLKHHELSMEKIRDLGYKSMEELKHSLLLDDYNVSFRIDKGDEMILDMGNASGGTAVKRIALCGDETCVLEISAK
jgi:hypothetical protein